jgi:hypothetical protein
VRSKGEICFCHFISILLKKHRLNSNCGAFIGTALKFYCINAPKIILVTWQNGRNELKQVDFLAEK